MFTIINSYVHIQTFQSSAGEEMPAVR